MAGVGRKAVWCIVETTARRGVPQPRALAATGAQGERCSVRRWGQIGRAIYKGSIEQSRVQEYSKCEVVELTLLFTSSKKHLKL